ncbi:membrane protein [Catenovulum agarivorans DS-2]|uniref:Membrane protein n=2 Tax=Catenovulum agarivorans TaxID=1172192 RepID=W7QSD3_9ALTE|nr:membrane protein [Catenovulum agarivorans DS-2]
MVNQGLPGWSLVLTASLGNTLGSVVNWYLGRYLLKFQHKKWFYFKQSQIDKSQKWFNRYGKWSLLFAWLPVGGDVLTLIAGMLRINLATFILLVGVGKTVRYISVLYFAHLAQYILA